MLDRKMLDDTDSFFCLSLDYELLPLDLQGYTRVLVLQGYTRGLSEERLVAKHVTVTRETIDSIFIGHSSERQQNNLAASGDTDAF